MKASDLTRIQDEYINLPVNGTSLTCPPVNRRGPIMLGIRSAFATAGFQGTNTQLSAQGGNATMDWGCDQFEQCHPISISSLRLNMNDATVNGVAFTNTVINLVQPVSILAGGPLPVIPRGR